MISRQMKEILFLILCIDWNTILRVYMDWKRYCMDGGTAGESFGIILGKKAKYEREY